MKAKIWVCVVGVRGVKFRQSLKKVDTNRMNGVTRRVQVVVCR